MALPWLSPNPRAERARPFGPAQRAVVDPATVPDVSGLLGGGHGPTPLYRLAALAATLELGDVMVKDESQRFGFGAFKALGGVLAVREYIAAEMRRTPADIVFTTASSGNHGRAVALGAQSVGARCTIFLPHFTTAAKEAAIRARGADVIRVAGDYEMAVAECRRVAAEKNWAIVSDTSWPGYETIPRSVMRGYTVLTSEAAEQWSAAPSHVFVQAGVGGLAAAVIGYLWGTMGERRPLFVVVEPRSADCWFQSNAAGESAPASGDAATAMGGLACREISPITWPIVGEGADWFMTIEEEDVAPARRQFAHPLGADPAIGSGPSGCAGLAALRRVAGNTEARKALELDLGSRVLLINSEGSLGEEPA